MAAPAPAIEQPASRANLALRPVQPADEAEPRWQPVLDLQCELTVDLAMPDFKIADLLKLRTGSVIDARLRVGRDLPLSLNGEQVGWIEFELVGERLALRLTELA
jgi:flagellar motor switch/type III secretory pathway protein FliN